MRRTLHVPRGSALDTWNINLVSEGGHVARPIAQWAGIPAAPDQHFTAGPGSCVIGAGGGGAGGGAIIIFTESIIVNGNRKVSVRFMAVQA